MNGTMNKENSTIKQENNTPIPVEIEMVISEDVLERILPNNKYIFDWTSALNEYLPSFEIDNTKRIASFLAQATHESQDFKRLSENLNYRPESLRSVFPKYFPTITLANQYAHSPERIANRVYANRLGNGSEASGDGWRYRGRGIFQLTGKYNYQKFADFVDMELHETIEFLETFHGAVLSACWFWDSRNLNTYADKGDIIGMTKRINGGTIGLNDRINRYNKILNILG